MIAEVVHDRLQSFRLDACVCYAEEDRPFVCSNISLLMRATGEVSDEATDEDAREVFNQVVRELLSGLLLASMGLQLLL